MARLQGAGLEEQGNGDETDEGGEGVGQTDDGRAGEIDAIRS